MQKRTLNNGLKVICYPIEHAMSVEIGLYIKLELDMRIKRIMGLRTCWNICILDNWET